MKIQEALLIGEMTMSSGPGQTDKQMSKVFELIRQQGKHVGDQDRQKILKMEYKGTTIYGIVNDDEVSSIVQTEQTKDPKVVTLLVSHTLTNFRNQNDNARLIWFINDQEGLSLIDYGVQSSKGTGYLNHLARTGRFDFVWINTKTGEKEPYVPDDDHHSQSSKYRSHKLTDWRMMIEGHDEPTFGRYAEFMTPTWYHTVFEDTTEDV